MKYQNEAFWTETIHYKPKVCIMNENEKKKTLLFMKNKNKAFQTKMWHDEANLLRNTKLRYYKWRDIMKQRQTL